ncbi:MAG: 4Fe-4S dicluster domain-containing protein [Candidatus Coatesbacteria bacterium]
MTRRRKALSRRQFLAAAGGTAAALTVPGRGRASAPALRENAFSMLVDTTRCIGCRSCVRACERANRLPVDEAVSDRPGPGPRLETAWNRWTTVNTEAEPGAGGMPPVFVKRQCMHCLEPACVSVCPVGAMYQTELGPVIYRAERCFGCRYCMISCPFDVPKFQWDSGLVPVIGKCQFCFQDRLLSGLSPACAEACPTGALKFGTREQTLFDAHARIRARPDRYHARVFGEEEAGGTCWLYLSDRPFDRLGFRKDLDRGSLPSLTWMVISRIPTVAAALAILFGVVAGGLKREEHGP